MERNRNSTTDDVLERLWAEASAVVLRAGFFVCDPQWTLRERVFPHYHLWLITGGRASLVIGGERFDVTGGDVLLVPPRVAYQGTHEPDHPLRCYTMHCQVRVLGATVPDALGSLPTALHPQPEAWQTIVSEAAAICRELDARAPGYALVANGSMTRIVGALWRTAAEEGAQDATQGDRRRAPAPVHPWLNDVLTYIAEHFGEPITLHDLANVAHLSPTHLSRMFRQAMGLAPFQYLHHWRMRRAKE
ncbi:MAG: AraC family transcriptional regulator, partial [Chloroflexota bacterium]